MSERGKRMFRVFVVGALALIFVVHAGSFAGSGNGAGSAAPRQGALDGLPSSRRPSAEGKKQSSVQRSAGNRESRPHDPAASDAALEGRSTRHASGGRPPPAAPAVQKADAEEAGADDDDEEEADDVDDDEAAPPPTRHPHFDGFEKKGASAMDRLNEARRRAAHTFREAKGFMSSELEGVVLKATRPDDDAVKAKHLEALLRPTHQYPREFNVYAPVVKKLWAKMTDSDWRTTLKSLYVLHRFAADGHVQHAQNLRDTVTLLREHTDAKRKLRYFDLDAVCAIRPAPWSAETPQALEPYAAFLRRYAEFVLLRVCRFSPGFSELMDNYSMVLGGGEALDAVRVLLAAGLRCELAVEKECPAAAAALLQVGQDLHDVLEACAAQLDVLSREEQVRQEYPEEVERWYTFLESRAPRVGRYLRAMDELADRYKHQRPPKLVATPRVLRRREEERARVAAEVAAAKKKAAAAAASSAAAGGPPASAGSGRTGAGGVVGAAAAREAAAADTATAAAVRRRRRRDAAAAGGAGGGDGGGSESSSAEDERRSPAPAPREHASRPARARQD